MKALDVNIEKSIRAITCYLVKQLCIDYNLSEDDVLCRLIKTDTYKLLVGKKSYLYAESPQYVYSMLKAELRGDIDSWMKI